MAQQTMTEELTKLSSDLAEKILFKIEQREKDIKEQDKVFIKENGEKILNFIHQYLDKLIDKSTIEHFAGYLYIRHSEMFFLTLTEDRYMREKNPECLTEAPLYKESKEYRIQNSEGGIVINGRFIAYPKMKNLESIACVFELVKQFLEKCQLKVKLEMKDDIHIILFSK